MHFGSQSEMKFNSKSKAKARLEQPATSVLSSTAGTLMESKSKPNQVEITYNQLVSLGMPSALIPLAEFRRIYSPLPPMTSHSNSNPSINSTMTKPSLNLTKSKAKDTTHATSTLTQAIDFICTHLVGRQEVRKRRARISQYEPRLLAKALSMNNI